VATKTTEDVLAEIRRRIDELEARAESGPARTQARFRSRLDALRGEEASAWAAVREKAEAVDDSFRQLEIDIAIAESRLASELADDAISFMQAAEAELHDLDAAIERLQTHAATKAPDARARAEADIAELRQARNRAAERLDGLGASANGTWRQAKDHVIAALDDLERQIQQTAGTNPPRRRHDH
jgi:chromosome segregation ATPase